MALENTVEAMVDESSGEEIVKMIQVLQNVQNDSLCTSRRDDWAGTVCFG